MKTEMQLNNSFNPLANPFIFSSNTVRIAVDDNGEVWFCAKDVFEALGVIWKRRAGSLKNYPESWIRGWYLQPQNSENGSKEMTFISEAAVYKVIFASNQPRAIEFANWVCAEVLPAIRRQGFYGTVSTKDRINFSRQISHLAERMAKNRDSLVHEFLVTEIRGLCNLIGLPFPSIALLGKDRDQLELPL